MLPTWSEALLGARVARASSLPRHFYFPERPPPRRSRRRLEDVVRALDGVTAARVVGTDVHVVTEGDADRLQAQIRALAGGFAVNVVRLEPA